LSALSVDNSTRVKETVFSTFSPVMKSHLPSRDKLQYLSSLAVSVLSGAVAGGVSAVACLELPKIAIRKNWISEFSPDASQILDYKYLIATLSFGCVFLMVSKEINALTIDRLGSNELKALMPKPENPSQLKINEPSIFSDFGKKIAYPCTALALRVYYYCCRLVFANSEYGKKLCDQIDRKIDGLSTNKLSEKRVEIHPDQSVKNKVSQLWQRAFPSNSFRSKIAMVGLGVLAIGCIYALSTNSVPSSSEDATNIFNVISPTMPERFSSLSTCIESQQDPKGLIDAHKVFHCEFFDRYASMVPREGYTEASKKAYRYMSRELHPDKEGNAAAFQVLRNARDSLVAIYQSEKVGKARLVSECIDSLGSSDSEISIEGAKRILSCGGFVPHCSGLQDYAESVAQQVHAIHPPLMDSVADAYLKLKSSCGWISAT